ncbi:hypothetical protein GCM10010358_38420 [Streptomyces minutiscleroticus]|uniref:Uncharacterized protein n=1 Tax=Streptomyces minutiscleroticus TaxID=68238 RepID=A0A918NMA6_9ACTN|nr:hypothetical protein GCM10010358_38420 [Streptomyces minutiscleroticus]
MSCTALVLRSYLHARICARLMDITSRVSPVSPVVCIDIPSDLLFCPTGLNGTETGAVASVPPACEVGQPRKTVPSVPSRIGRTGCRARLRDSGDARLRAAVGDSTAASWVVVAVAARRKKQDP